MVRVFGLDKLAKDWFVRTMRSYVFDVVEHNSVPNLAALVRVSMRVFFTLNHVGSGRVSLMGEYRNLGILPFIALVQNKRERARKMHLLQRVCH